MKPYIGESHKGSQKYQLEGMNANRSRKKAARQDSKKEILKSL